MNHAVASTPSGRAVRSRPGERGTLLFAAALTAKKNPPRLASSAASNTFYVRCLLAFSGDARAFTRPASFQTSPAVPLL